MSEKNLCSVLLDKDFLINFEIQKLFITYENMNNINCFTDIV